MANKLEPLSNDRWITSLRNYWPFGWESNECLRYDRWARERDHGHSKLVEIMTTHKMDIVDISSMLLHKTYTLEYCPLPNI